MNALSKTIVLACCVIGLRASAQLTEYSDITSWDAAVNPASVTSLNFEGIVPPLGFTYYPASGLTLGAVNFQYTSPTPGVLFVLGDNYYYPGQPAELSPQDFGPDPAPGDPDGMTVAFNSPVTAINMTIESFFDTPFTFTIGANSYTETAPSLDNGLAFVGITSDTPFSSFTVTTPAEFSMNFASLDYASAPDEFSTAWALGVGLLGCGVFRRFRR